MFNKTSVAIAVVALLAMALPASAALVPVFEYQFPASASTLTPSPATVTDVSSAGNNATGRGWAVSGLSVAPTGMSGNSVDFAAGANAYIITTGTNLLTNATIAAAGGFTYDVYFNASSFTNSTSTPGEILTEGNAGGLWVGTNGKMYVNMFNGADQPVTYDTALSINTWYHAVVQFDSTGNVVDANGDLAGQLTVTLNGSVVIDSAQTRDPLYDSNGNNYGIAMGAHSAYPDYCHFVGKVYNPSVYLGTAVPEPGTIALLATGLLGLLAYAWRKRKQ